jgi:hypothetical protein
LGNSRFAPLPQWMRLALIVLGVFLVVVVVLHLTGHTPHHHFTSPAT